MKLLICVSLLLLALPWNPVPAQAEQRDTLEQILTRAYDRDPRIAAKRLELDAAGEGIVQARAGYFPQIHGVGEYGSFHYKDPLQRDGDRRTFGLEASQLLFDFGRTGGKIDQAKVAVKRLAWELESLIQKIGMETINAYLAYLEAVEILSLHEQNKSNFGEQLKGIKEEVEAGMNLITNQSLVESRYDLASARLEQARAKVHQSRIALERLTGPLPEGLLSAPSEDLGHIFPIPETLSEALAQASTSFPEIQTAKEDVASAQAFHKQTKAELLPSLYLKGLYQTGSFGEADADATSAQVVFNLPLFQGGANWSRIREARKTLRQKQHLLSATEERLQEEVKIVWSEIASLANAINAWERSMALEYQVLEGIKEQVQYELVPLRELLQAQEDVVQKEMEFTKLVFQKTATQFRLAQLINGKSLTKFD